MILFTNSITSTTRKTNNISIFSSSSTSLSWDQIAKNSAFHSDNIEIDAVENESNNAYISVTATDNAGNTNTTTKELKIDVTKPKINISFDNNHAMNGTYYSQNRVAKVEIEELNFDPNEVYFKIYKDGVEDSTFIPDKTSWKNTDGSNIYTTFITFSEDGDYSFEVQCTDLAGNESDKEVTDAFTIDKTKPIVEVTYDNNNAWKENYYNQARTATISITEHNFDAKDFSIAGTPQVSVSGWTHDGDLHKANIHFENEEHYTYSIDFTDMAGNNMGEFQQEEFYIDMSEPVIEISGVKDYSANAGDVIPFISVFDDNYDGESMQISLFNSKGKEIEIKQNVAGYQGGFGYTLSDVNKQPDEIYTLSVKAFDMAGNSSELIYHFSLNRNGSTYDLSQISALVDKAYIRYSELEDLQIREMNVNSIEKFDLYVTRNGESITSERRDKRPNTMDASVFCYTTDINGNDDIGYEYNYTLYKESFRQEGIYNIMFYSKDKAGNEVNSTLEQKDAKLTFVVDNTAPTVVIEGVEPGEFYIEDTKEVNVYVSDNFKLQEASFHVVDEDGNVIQTYNYVELAEEEGDIVTLTLSSNNKKQSIQYYAIDAAGNSVATIPEDDVATSFMITTDAWLRYIHSKKSVAATVVGGIAAIMGGAGIFFFRRRKTALAKANK